MKKIILFYLIAVISKIGIAQPYQSIFGKDSTTWAIMWSGSDYSDEGNFNVILDTTYQSKRYKMTGREGYNYAFIREDTLNGQIWAVDLLCNYNNNNTERLVANMSLQVGDSFSINMLEIIPNPADTFIVVDSVYYVQGQKRIRFASPPASVYSEQFTEPITFIEGIGPNYLLLWLVGNECSGFGDKYLLCVFKDGVEADYTNLRYNGQCYPDFEGVKDVNLNKISITPNPATNQLLISTNDFQAQTITIYNLNGQQVISIPFAREVDISVLPPGVYFVQVRGTEGTEMGKLVKM